mmetsp:Transcript_58346/g.181229  ORF Transcript_58346/g.181229 Transcript_58346/m.181229 type:complete len:381 (+) Transcript_58346:208-1350(+)
MGDAAPAAGQAAYGRQGPPGHAPHAGRPAAWVLAQRDTTPALAAARLYGSFVHSVVLTFGLVFLIQVGNISASLSAQGQWFSSGTAMSSLKDALVLLLGNLLAPFGDASFLESSMPESPSVDVWGFWVPGILSVFFLSVASLGLATMRCRRPSRAVPYTFLAAIFVVWQAQVGQALLEMSTWEGVGDATGAASPTAPKQVQEYLFKTAHESFAQSYVEHRCRAAKAREGATPLIRCEADTMEAKLVPIIVQEVCRARTDGTKVDFESRVASCRARGQRMRLFPSASQEADNFYCRCWPAVFSALRITARWIMVIWIGLLAGVLSVLYVAAEPKLSRMSSKEHSEVLCFAVASMILLACRVIWLPDGLPWLRSLTGSLQEE